MATELKCPECGKNNAVCTHEDIGGPMRYRFEFTFYCPDCGYTKTEHEDGGEVGYNEARVRCPFCDSWH